MGNDFLFLTLWTLVAVKTCCLCPAEKHFLHILMNSRTNAGMGSSKLLPVICENLFEFLASDNLHTVEAEGKYYLICYGKRKRGSP